MERMWRVIRYEQVGSTNEVCKALAARGADDTAVTALTQTAGKGRLGRSFQSPEGGLYLSALWRDCGGAELLRVTPMAAVAVCRAVERLCGAKCGIKWCNDVVLAGRKLCGILTESHLRPDGSAEWLVVGIGVNVAQTAFPSDIADTATSLALCGYEVDRDALAEAILEELDGLRAGLERPEAWRTEYRARCVNMGKTVRVLRGGEARQARALDIDGEFGLTVEYEDGSRETVRSGEVSVRGLYGYIECGARYVENAMGAVLHLRQGGRDDLRRRHGHAADIAAGGGGEQGLGHR